MFLVLVLVKKEEKLYVLVFVESVKECLVLVYFKTKLSWSGNKSTFIIIFL